MKLKMAGLVAGMSLLGACATTVPLAPIETKPVDPAYLAAAKNKKIYHVTPLAFRTFGIEAGKDVEVTGVPCKVTTPYYTASVVTPAFVNIPSMGEDTPNAKVTCAYKGYTAGFVSKPENYSKLKKIQGSQYLGLPGVLLAGLGAEATTNPETSIYVYTPPFLVDLVRSREN